jgi:hypothetical protein
MRSFNNAAVDQPIAWVDRISRRERIAVESFL